MRLLVGLIFLFCASAVQAQGLFSMGSREEGRQWEAVGRLEIAGVAFCTGALVTPGIVLTAAHCLYDSQTGERVPVDRMQFLAGWRNGRAAAYRLIRKAVPHPDYDYGGPADGTRVQTDLALIELQHPIRNNSIQPFPTASRPDPGARVGVVSYAHDRSEAPSLQELCDVLSVQDGMIVMSCAVDFGASGSPVFTFDAEGAPRIVSVISAKAEADGKPVSIAMDMEEPLAELWTAFDTAADAGAGLERMQAGARRDTGAKFITP